MPPRKRPHERWPQGAIDAHTEQIGMLDRGQIGGQRLAGIELSPTLVERARARLPVEPAAPRGEHAVQAGVREEAGDAGDGVLVERGPAVAQRGGGRRQRALDGDCHVY